MHRNLVLQAQGQSHIVLRFVLESLLINPAVSLVPAYDISQC